MDRDWSAALAEAVRTFDGRVRLKLRGESHPELWGAWLTAPADGYLEVEGCGPYAIRELEWVEVEPTGGPAQLLSALTAAGLAAAVAPAAVRVTPPAGPNDSPG